jgi:hypothetical protein
MTTYYVVADETGAITGHAEEADVLPGAVESEIFDPERPWDFVVVDGEVVPAGPRPPPPPPRILTHYGFRSLLTLSEQIILDNFDVAEFAAAHPVLSAFGPIEKATLRTAMKAYETASEINLDDAGVAMFVGALAQMGLLEGDGEVRRQTILAGYAPGQLPESAGEQE